MGIESVGSLQNILKTHDTKKWVESSEIKGAKGKLELDQGDKPKLDGGGQKTFGQFLADSMGQVNQMQHKANVAIQKLATGESKNIHETMLAVEQADIAFKTMNQVRMKVIDAYKEVMRMQI